jgi:hypothetical protein
VLPSTRDREARVEAEDAQGRRDPRAETQGSHGRLPQDRAARQEALVRLAEFCLDLGNSRSAVVLGRSLVIRQCDKAGGDMGHADGNVGVSLVVTRPPYLDFQVSGVHGAERLRLNGLGEQGVEHGRLHVAAVVAPRVLVEVALQPLLRDRVNTRPGRRS